MYLKQIGINMRNCVDSAQNTDYWTAFMNATLNLQVPWAMELVNYFNFNTWFKGQLLTRGCQLATQLACRQTEVNDNPASLGEGGAWSQSVKYPSHVNFIDRIFHYRSVATQILYYIIILGRQESHTLSKFSLSGTELESHYHDALN